MIKRSRRQVLLTRTMRQSFARALCGRTAYVSVIYYDQQSRATYCRSLACARQAVALLKDVRVAGRGDGGVVDSKRSSRNGKSESKAHDEAGELHDCEK